MAAINGDIPEKENINNYIYDIISQKNKIGIGIFCQIFDEKYGKELAIVLITNNNVPINKNKIEINLKGEIINLETKDYFNKNEIAIIEINEKQEQKHLNEISFIEIYYSGSNNIKNKEFIDKQVYLLDLSVVDNKEKNNTGIIENINFETYKIDFLCFKKGKTSGGLIIYLDNSKIQLIGVYSSINDQKYWKNGIFISEYLQDIYDKYFYTEIRIDNLKKESKNLNSKKNNDMNNQNIKESNNLKNHFNKNINISNVSDYNSNNNINNQCNQNINNNISNQNQPNIFTNNNMNYQNNQNVNNINYQNNQNLNNNNNVSNQQNQIIINENLNKQNINNNYNKNNQQINNNNMNGQNMINNNNMNCQNNQNMNNQNMNNNMNIQNMNNNMNIQNMNNNMNIQNMNNNMNNQNMNNNMNIQNMNNNMNNQNMNNNMDIQNMNNNMNNQNMNNNMNIQNMNNNMNNQNMNNNMNIQNMNNNMNNQNMINNMNIQNMNNNMNNQNMNNNIDIQNMNNNMDIQNMNNNMNNQNMNNNMNNQSNLNINNNMNNQNNNNVISQNINNNMNYIYNSNLSNQNNNNMNNNINQFINNIINQNSNYFNNNNMDNQYNLNNNNQFANNSNQNFQNLNQMNKFTNQNKFNSNDLYGNKYEDFYPYIKENKINISFKNNDNVIKDVSIPSSLRNSELYYTADMLNNPDFFDYSDVNSINLYLNNELIPNNNEPINNIVFNGAQIFIKETIEDLSYYKTLIQNSQNPIKTSVQFDDKNGKKFVIIFPSDIAIKDMIHCFYAKNKIPESNRQYFYFHFKSEKLALNDNNLLSKKGIINSSTIEFTSFGINPNSDNMEYLKKEFPGKKLMVSLIRNNDELKDKIYAGSLQQIKSFYEKLKKYLHKKNIEFTGKAVILNSETEINIKESDERTFSSIGILNDFKCKIE